MLITISKHSNNPSSFAFVQHSAELCTMLDHALELLPFVRHTIIDIWCGDWKKSIPLLNEIISQSDKGNKYQYVWLDFSPIMLRSARNTFDHHANELIDGRFSSLDLFSDEMKDKLSNASVPTTYLMLWWTPCNFSKQNLTSFLDKMFELMSKWDTFIINFYTYGNHDQWDHQLTLQELQANFIRAEKQRYKQYNLFEVEKRWDIANFQIEFPWIKIFPNDFSLTFFFDASRQMLVDRRTYHNDIYWNGEKIIGQWEYFDSLWTTLDDDFFAKSVDWQYEDFVGDLYTTNESREFVLSLFKALGCEDHALSYKVASLGDTPGKEIFVDCLKKQPICLWDIKYTIPAESSFHVTQTARYTDEEIHNIFWWYPWREIVHSFPIVLQHQYANYSYETMRSYVIEKK